MYRYLKAFNNIPFKHCKFLKVLSREKRQLCPVIYEHAAVAKWVFSKK